MKNVVIVTCPFNVGGGQVMVHNLIKCMSGCKITVICTGTRKDNTLTKEVEEICDVHYVYGNHFSIYIKLCKLLKKINPDIIHSHLTGYIYTSIWALFHKKHIIVTLHTTPENAIKKKVEPIIKFLLFRKKCTCVAVSEKNYEMSKKYFNIYDSRIEYVNNGILLDKYYRVDNDCFTFINMARQDQNKNQFAIIDAFKLFHNKHNESRLILAGDGPEHNKLIKYAQSLNLEDYISFPGSVNDCEVYYAMSDIYIQSSHREGLPLSVLEAMAAGLPVISTDVGGMKDIVDGNGILVPDNDVCALYTAMEDVYSSKELYNQMSDKSLEIVKNFSAECMAEKYLKIYTDRM